MIIPRWDKMESARWDLGDPANRAGNGWNSGEESLEQAA
jgi:hypothetical protein